MEEKDKIKVYLQFPWKFTDSSYYKYLLESPPENIEYLNTGASKGVITSKNKFKFSNLAKTAIRRTSKKLSLPMPNMHLTKKTQGIDAIHNAHCISMNKNLPWVADIEFSKQFFVGDPTKTGKRIVKKLLKRKNCKKILAWTEWSKKNILKEFPEIIDKVEVVYPAMPSNHDKKRKNNGKKLRLLFISRRFYFKGGLQAVELMDRITKRFSNVEGKIISDTPEDIVEKYGNNKKIIFEDMKEQNEIFEKEYPNADIIVYPAFTDTFGFVNLEALSFGIPLIGVRGHCNEEIIQEGKTGHLIEPPKIEKANYTLEHWEKPLEKMQEKTEKLIKDKKLRQKMSENARKEIESGKFSIKERNKKLKRIYKEALR
ncbi:MAG: glycosyltransferase family 4 protein [Candidatus Pacearchaeota archaeon]